MTDADKFSHGTFGWRIMLTMYTVMSKNAEFYPGFLLFITIKKHLNAGYSLPICLKSKEGSICYSSLFHIQFATSLK